MIDLRLQAFDHRTARTHWGMESPEAALRVHAVLGGAPGYLPLAGRPAPVYGDGPPLGLGAWTSASRHGRLQTL
ncbi:hypothetical protein [Planomonospora sp. ID82291]|uniref:hypothetical protein n=1 Tax=Planomonospora sp. ID82291 TaxID=2738136 RepID=UPI0018C40061|nr:hypothetical protein [Planomonospora sp. ID82291]